jgi:transcriptional regulator with XRE-family HTH domain
MTIGQKIKSLRRKKDLTQEDLAEKLGVSSKAVSQWECDRTCPDISLLPSICNLFNVSSDELLGIDVGRKNAERQKLLDEEYELAKNGYQSEAWMLLTDGIKRFPGDFRIMQAIILRSVFVLQLNEYADQREKITEDCKRYADLIMDGCNEDSIRHTAIVHLCSYYAKKGNTDKALELAYRMPILCQSRDFIVANIYNGEKNIRANQNLKHDLVQFLVNRMTHNYKTDSGEALYSADEIAALRDKAIAFLELMFEDGDLGFYHGIATDIHKEQARLYYAQIKDEKMVLHHLSMAAYHAIEFIKFMRSGEYSHTSLLFKGRENSSAGVMLSQSDNDVTKLIRHLDRKEYDFIEDRTAIEALKKKLRPFAEKNQY